MNKIFFVILAGGSGSRLWPLSRERRPKQLMPFLGDKSLLEQTVERVENIVLPGGNSPDSNSIFVVTNKNQAELVKEVVGDRAGIFSEPESRNTAPAILLSCLEIERLIEASFNCHPGLDPGSNPLLDPVVVFLSADAFIPDQKKFNLYIKDAIDYASSNDRIVTLGLKPRFAATGYGYIQADLKGKDKNFDCYKVLKFHEKPTSDVAEYYLSCSEMFWNIGIFVSKVKVLLSEFKKHQPVLTSNLNSATLNVSSEFEGVKYAGYSKLPNISIDYAIMEKSKIVTVFPADFDWYDVGNLEVFLSLQDKYIDKKVGVINIDGTNNLVSAKKKLVVFIGVDDLCLVETEDVILVSKKKDVEKVKGVLPIIKNNSFKELL